MLDRLGFTAMMDTVLDLKTRSKLFLSFTEATVHVHADFDKKLALIYPEKKDHQIRHISVLNPAFMMPGSNLMQALAERFGGKALDNWDENCCSAIFFAEAADEDDDEDRHTDPNSWMVKYEVFYTDDAIELSGNGDFVFSPLSVPHNMITSTYH